MHLGLSSSVNTSHPSPSCRAWSIEIMEWMCPEPALEKEDCSISKISLAGTFRPNGQSTTIQQGFADFALERLIEKMNVHMILQCESWGSKGKSIQLDSWFSRHNGLEESRTPTGNALAKALQHQTGMQAYPPERWMSSCSHLCRKVSVGAEGETGWDSSDTVALV